MTISEQRPELHNLVHLHSNLVKINRSADQLSSNQLATLSLEISKSSINYENRIAALVVEKNLLNSVARHLWRDYDNAIAPYHRVDNQFVQIYDQLIKIRDELVKIDTSGLTSDKFGSVREIADRLVTLESTHCANGVFFNDKTVPSLEGQDILTALLNRNFMTIDDLLTRKPSSCEFLGALSSKLARIIRSLETLKSEFLFPDIENTVHTTTEIKMILEHLNDLEKMKKNGLFLKEGAAYPDQEYIHDMMENARGLIQICIAYNSFTTEMDIGDDQFQTMLKVAMNSSDEIRGHVLSASNSSVATRKVSLVTIECIQKSLDNGMAMVKSCTQKEKITGADRLLSAVIQCAQHDLVKFLGMFDKVDPTLFKTRDCLFEIQREFICLRNEKTVSRVCGQEINQGNRLVDMINAVASTKDKYETDHGFLNEAGSVAGGQRLLKALLNECLCLLVQCL